MPRAQAGSSNSRETAGFDHMISVNFNDSSRMLMQTARTVLIAGGGIAGLTLATRLGHSLGRTGKARIVLVDRSPTHVWKPMKHTFAAGTCNAVLLHVRGRRRARRVRRLPHDPTGRPPDELERSYVTLPAKATPVMLGLDPRTEPEDDEARSKAGGHRSPTAAASPA